MNAYGLNGEIFIEMSKDEATELYNELYGVDGAYLDKLWGELNTVV